MDDSLHQRGKALEDRFFVQKDKELLEKLRQQRLDQVTKEDISKATGITDEQLLERLVEMEINVQTLTALSVVPLVEIAWADGKMDDKERAAILSAADDAGIAKDAPGYRLLNEWLNDPPEPALLAVWKDYVAALAHTLDQAGYDQVRDNLISRARKVAEAAGGFLGMKKISDAEQKKLNELEQAFK